MIRRLTACLAIFALPANAETLTCAQDLVTVDAPAPLARRICDLAETAVQDLATCNLPLKAPVSLTLSDYLANKSCAGVYHCGESRIEILAPDLLEKATRAPDLFYALDTESYFASVIFHELAHAAYDGTPCPFGDTCRATMDYLAYSLQIRALDEATREKMGLHPVPQTPVSADEINAMILLLAPDRFAAKAYAHLMQQPDPCAFVAQVAAGKVFFDYAAP